MITVSLVYNGQVMPDLDLPEHTTVSQTLHTISVLASGQLNQQVTSLKLIGPNGLRVDRLPGEDELRWHVGKSSEEEHVRVRLKLFVVTAQDLAKVRGVDAKVERAKGEAVRAAQRKRRQRSQKRPTFKVEDGVAFGFKGIKVLENLPDARRAKKILRVLATDPGVLGCMKEKGYTVGSLEELLPDGKVGVSDVCVMGLNQNKGQKILLRLRTDDLRGWRPLSSVKKVLYHELAHNEISDHNSDFFALMSDIKTCCEKHDFRLHGGERNLAGEKVREQWQTVVEGGDRPGLWELSDDDDNGDDGGNEPVYQSSSGVSVGGHGRDPGVPARAAAAEAAKKRMDQLSVEVMEMDVSARGKKRLSSGEGGERKSKGGERKSKGGERKSEGSERKSEGNARKNSDAHKRKSTTRNSQPTNTPNHQPTSQTPTSNAIEPALSGKEGQVERAVNHLLNAPDGRDAAKVIFKVINNALQNIDQRDSKFFNVNAKPGLQRRIENPVTFENSLRVLREVGFVESSSVAADGVQRRLVLKRKDPGLLWLAKSIMESNRRPSLESR